MEESLALPAITRTGNFCANAGGRGVLTELITAASSTTMSVSGGSPTRISDPLKHKLAGTHNLSLSLNIVEFFDISRQKNTLYT
jgi:hypothetical protein